MLTGLDWIVVAAFMVAALVIGVLVARRAGENSTEFFLSGRTMPWWLLGISMVATTFSADTPNLVADITRTGGVAGNWAWWAFLLTGLLTAFVYAQLWRRSEVLTDVEFYELRYSGASAALLRGFRALYLGVLFNVLVMASVTLAAIKIGAVLFGLSPVAVVMIAGGVTVIYSAFGGLRGVILTDFLLFCTAMVGSVAAAYVVTGLPQVGGLEGLLAHERVAGKLSLLPDFTDTSTLVPLLIIPLAVQWWSVWYPGAEPGGGGYVAQRILAARNERHATGAVLLFNAAHYALRPWPWIIVALASLIVFPDLEALRAQVPDLPERYIGHDLAYSVMLGFLPSGFLGLVVASLVAAYMSTISTHLNWGSSYIVNDFWARFIKPGAPERELVFVGRISTVLLMVLAALLALALETALGTFNIMLQIGAGTGLLFILRWFWWRINAWSEITAMVVSFLVAVYFQLIYAPADGQGLEGWQILVIGVAITTVAWVAVTFLTPPTDARTLRSFVLKIQPGGPGWKRVMDAAERDGQPIPPAARRWDVPRGVLCMVLGCGAIYGALFATGYWIYGNVVAGLVATVVAAGCAAALLQVVKGLKMMDGSPETGTRKQESVE